MPHVSFRVTEEEKRWMDSYAKLHGTNVSDALKAVFFEKLENDYDLQTLREYELDNAKAAAKQYPLEDVKRELGL